MSERANRVSFLRKLLQSLQRHRVFRWAKVWLFFVLFLAIFGDFIANDVPLYCRYQGGVRFPVFAQFFGLDRTFNAMTDWSSDDFTSKIFPPIPYHFDSIDPSNSQFVSPVAAQKISSIHFRHWLGTDQIGRDVLAGMISGARVSVVIGFLGIGLAALIGLLLGSLSGYYGDQRLKWSVIRLVISMVLLVVLAWFAYVLPMYLAAKSGLIWLGLILVFVWVQWLLRRFDFGVKKITLPLDTITMRILEVFNAIPKLLLVLVISVLLPPSVLVIAMVIGLTHWPTIALYTRGEMIKIRQKEYLIAAQIQNIPNWKILWRHALPNAIGPAMISIMLGLGSAILAEAFLSFLGLGLPPDLVSWGKLLAAARGNISAWWMAIFPGLAIFLTIFSANRIGEILLEEMKAE